MRLIEEEKVANGGKLWVKMDGNWFSKNNKSRTSCVSLVFYLDQSDISNCENKYIKPIKLYRFCIQLN